VGDVFELGGVVVDVIVKSHGDLGDVNPGGRRVVRGRAVAPAQERRPDAPGAVLLIPQREGVVSTALDESAESVRGVEAEPLALTLEPRRLVPAETRRQRLAWAVHDCAYEWVVKVGA